MRIVLNTRSDDTAAGACVHDLGRRLAARGAAATVNDWGRYDRYDVAVFVAYDHEIDEARRQNPAIRIVLADPKQRTPEAVEAARGADLLLVSSVEQRDVFLRTNRNVLVYTMFPAIAARAKDHADRPDGAIVVGYHGNRVHLEAMAHSVRPALEELGRRRPVELRAVYNIETLGKARLGIPDERFVRVRHIQWTPAFPNDLAGVDIGIVPSELPVANALVALELTALPEPEFAYEPFDHLVRYKASTNPGRLYPFARLGIPVVADFTPSAAQFVEDGVTGLLASSPHGWLEALDVLAGSAELRARLAAGLRERLDAAYERQLDDFVAALALPRKPAPAVIPGALAVAEQQALLDRYAGPARSRGLARRARRLLRLVRR